MSLVINPALEEYLGRRDPSGVGYTVLAGPNNCGKSYWLKAAARHLGNSACLMTANRFYHVNYLEFAAQQPNFLQELYQNQTHMFNSPDENREHAHVNFSQIFSRLKDPVRIKLLETCRSLLGFEFTIQREDPENTFSRQYLTVDNVRLPLTSSGVRLLLVLLCACYYPEFEYILIDEPELGLSPNLQGNLADLLSNPIFRKEHFPHLRHIFVATHSHLFLNRLQIGSNAILSRIGNNVQLRAVTSIQELHKLQFDLLGNRLESMYMPAAIVLVEGPTDRDFIDAVIRSKYPDRRVAIVNAEGDGGINSKLRTFKEAFGDLRASPYHNRLLAVLDKVHSQRLDRFATAGLPLEHVIVWDKNGIENYYPARALANAFSCTEADLSKMAITGNSVSLNGFDLAKTELSTKIIANLKPEDTFPLEFQQKFLDTLDRVLQPSCNTVVREARGVGFQ